MASGLKPGRFRFPPVTAARALAVWLFVLAGRRGHRRARLQVQQQSRCVCTTWHLFGSWPLS